MFLTPLIVANSATSAMHRRIVGDDCNLLSEMRKASLHNFISFCRGRLSLATIVECLPELAPSLKYFGKQSISQWTVEMSRYNQTCTSTSGTGWIFPPQMQHLQFVLLDLFLCVLDFLLSCHDQVLSQDLVVFLLNVVLLVKSLPLDHFLNQVI